MAQRCILAADMSEAVAAKRLTQIADIHIELCIIDGMEINLPERDATLCKEHVFVPCSSLDLSSGFYPGTTNIMTSV